MQVTNTKSNNEFYNDIIFVLISTIMFVSLYFYAVNKGYFNDIEIEAKSIENSITKESQKSFQPGDKDAIIPQRLKWGRDFKYFNER